MRECKAKLTLWGEIMTKSVTPMQTCNIVDLGTVQARHEKENKFILHSCHDRIRQWGSICMQTWAQYIRNTRSLARALTIGMMLSNTRKHTARGVAHTVAENSFSHRPSIAGSRKRRNGQQHRLLGSTGHAQSRSLDSEGSRSWSKSESRCRIPVPAAPRIVASVAAAAGLRAVRPEADATRNRSRLDSVADPARKV